MAVIVSGLVRGPLGFWVPVLNLGVWVLVGPLIRRGVMLKM